MFTLWIWPENRNPETEETVRNALRSRGFDFKERVEECMSDPVVIDTGFEELTPESLDLLDRYEIKEGELLLCGMNEQEFDKKVFGK